MAYGTLATACQELQTIFNDQSGRPGFSVVQRAGQETGSGLVALKMLS